VPALPRRLAERARLELVRKDRLVAIPQAPPEKLPSGPYPLPDHHPGLHTLTGTGPTRQLARQATHAIEIAFLTLATIYSLTLPLKSHVTLADAAVLVVLFACYTLRISRAPAEAPHLVGPAVLLGELPTTRRRVIVAALLGDEATVKRFYRERDHIRLQPENRSMSPILTRDATVLGKVVALIRCLP